MSHFLPDLEGSFRQLQVTEPRRAAEIAYVLALKRKQEAVMERKNGWSTIADMSERDAEKYGVVCMEMFRALNIQTEREAAAHYVPTLNGIPVPELIHEGVVLANLRDAGLTLAGV